MIPLKCIVEYAILQGQSYDIGPDILNFNRTIDGTTEQIKQKFERNIDSKLKGKRVRARASRGYKQFEKDYEFDVSRITIDDYYDNFVVVAHDESSGKKPKEYFLKPGAKIQIIGLASGHPSPSTTPNEPQDKIPRVVASPEQPKDIQPKSTSLKEEEKEEDIYEAYSIEAIEEDIKPWLSELIKDPRLEMRGFIKSLGWKKNAKDGKEIALYDITIPMESTKIKLTREHINNIIRKSTPLGGDIKFVPVDFSEKDKNYKIRIKKSSKIKPSVAKNDPNVNETER